MSERERGLRQTGITVDEHTHYYEMAGGIEVYHHLFIRGVYVGCAKVKIPRKMLEETIHRMKVSRERRRKAGVR